MTDWVEKEARSWDTDKFWELCKLGICYCGCGYCPRTDWKQIEKKPPMYLRAMFCQTNHSLDWRGLWLNGVENGVGSHILKWARAGKALQSRRNAFPNTAQVGSGQKGFFHPREGAASHWCFHCMLWRMAAFSLAGVYVPHFLLLSKREQSQGIQFTERFWTHLHG